MEEHLTPKEAWNCANEAYTTKAGESEFRKIFSDASTSPLKNILDVSGLEVIKGGSGWFGSTSNFGFIAPLKKFPSEFVLATRGTLTKADFCSDITISLQSGPGDHQVHSGFHNVWESFFPQVSSYFMKRRASKIHCVGHSLGGALANLNAGYLSSSMNVCLYTFGEPRAGLREYSEYLSKRILAKDVLRVRNETDVVTMVPCFGYIHAPYDNDTILLDGGFSPISVTKHSMDDGYKKIGEEGATWESLRRDSLIKKDRLCQSMSLWRENDQFYLDQLSSFPGGFMSSRLLALINAAIDDIFRRMGSSGLLTVGKYGTGNFTVLDQLSEMIYRFGQTTVAAQGAVTSILKSMLHFLGKVVSAVIDASIATLRWVIGQFLSVVTQIASRALSMVG